MRIAGGWASDREGTARSARRKSACGSLAAGCDRITSSSDTRSHCTVGSGRHGAAGGGRRMTGGGKRQVSTGLVSGVYHNPSLEVLQAAVAASRGQLSCNSGRAPKVGTVMWCVGFGRLFRSRGYWNL